MPTRDRRGAQLSVELPPDLLARLRAHAAAADRPVAAVVRRWVEAGLSGALEAGAAAPAGGSDLLARVEALERAIAALQQNRAPRIPKPAPAAKGSDTTFESLPLDLDLGPTGPNPEPPAGALTTAELADRTGSNRAAWNNWASKAAPGDVRHHPEAGSWRLVGKAPAPGGGPDRWLWEQA
jgi:predicted transcriptional regulator